MQRVTEWKMVFSACLAATLLTALARAEDKKPAAKALDRHTLDESIYQNLRGIIDHGADLYNQGDWNGCYRLWEGALMSLKPLLDHRPKLQEAIDGGLTNARQDAMLWHRAWVLRGVLDKVRAEIDADHPHWQKDENGNPVARPEPKPEPKPNPKPTTAAMWDRLGGEVGVTQIVDDFVNLVVAPDSKVDFFRQNKVKLDAEHVVKMKREFVEQISQLTGGPLKYTGPDMKKVHKDMGITNEQFDDAAADLKKALEKNKVGAEDMKKILDAVYKYRKEIVQPKKPADKKPIEKKPEAKKPAASVNVSGKVTYKGKPAAAAKISLVSADGKAVSDTIAVNGSYQLAVKPGVYTVTISGAGKLALPAKYAGVDTSGLKLNIIPGKQNHDLSLQ